MKYKISMEGTSMPPEVLKVLFDESQMKRFHRAVETLRDLMGLDDGDTLRLEIEEATQSNVIPFDRR